jgi:hypothetical protein
MNIPIKNTFSAVPYSMDIKKKITNISKIIENINDSQK